MMRPNMEPCRRERSSSCILSGGGGVRMRACAFYEALAEEDAMQSSAPITIRTCRAQTPFPSAHTEPTRGTTTDSHRRAQTHFTATHAHNLSAQGVTIPLLLDGGEAGRGCRGDVLLHQLVPESLLVLCRGVGKEPGWCA